MKALQIPGTLDSLIKLREFVTTSAEHAGLTKKQTSRLKLAVDEIATNAIVYGYEKKGRQGVLYAQAEFGEESLTIILEDEGDPFDPSRVEPPDDLDLPPDERAIGGLGIFLTLQQVSKFRYERAGNKNRNIFVVEKKS